MQLIKEIKKIGNGNYISIPATLLKEGILKKGVKYRISIIEADLEHSENLNDTKKDYSNFL